MVIVTGRSRRGVYSGLNSRRGQARLRVLVAGTRDKSLAEIGQQRCDDVLTSEKEDLVCLGCLLRDTHQRSRSEGVRCDLDVVECSWC